MAKCGLSRTADGQLIGHPDKAGIGYGRATRTDKRHRSDGRRSPPGIAFYPGPVLRMAPGPRKRPPEVEIEDRRPKTEQI